MSSVIDPLHRLITRESIRFVGTVGDVMSSAIDTYSAVLTLFQEREVRSLPEIIDAVMRAADGKKDVAAHTAEVVAAIGLTSSVGSAAGGQKKYVLDEHGRAIVGLMRHERWHNKAWRRLAFLRPMFEANGDYLLQALSAIEGCQDRAAALQSFRVLVNEMVESKIDEILPESRGGRWQAYKEGLEVRRAAIIGARPALGDGRPTIRDLQKQKAAEEKKLREALKSGSKATSEAHATSEETKTLEHHFMRCRAWLIDLDLIKVAGKSGLELTNDGQALMSFVRKVSGRQSKLRLPPSTATLVDCFRLNTEEIERIWGFLVDDAFWEELVLAIVPSGRYQPTTSEAVAAFQDGFDAVRVKQISEAGVTPLREYMFFSWLWSGRPVATENLSAMFVGPNAIPTLFPNKFGYGRNRQGRIAYVFRKA